MRDDDSIKCLEPHLHVVKLGSDKLLVVVQTGKWFHRIIFEQQGEKVSSDDFHLCELLLFAQVDGWYTGDATESFFEEIKRIWNEVDNKKSYYLLWEQSKRKITLQESSHDFIWEPYSSMRVKFRLYPQNVSYKEDGSWKEKTVPCWVGEVYDPYDRELGKIVEDVVQPDEARTGKSYRTGSRDVRIEACAIWNLTNDEAKGFIESFKAEFPKLIESGEVKEVVISPKKNGGEVTCKISRTKTFSLEEIARRSSNTAEFEGRVVAKMSFRTETVRKNYPKYGTQTYETCEEQVPYGLVKTLDDKELFKVYCGHEMEGIMEPVYGHHAFRFNNVERIIPLAPIPEDSPLLPLLVGYGREFNKAILQHTFNNGEDMDGVLEGVLVFKRDGWHKFELIPIVVKEKPKEESKKEDDEVDVEALCVMGITFLLVVGMLVLGICKIIGAFEL